MSSGPDGILVLDKPAGITSMTAVAIVRRAAGGVRTGHAGTLDPLATGVLVIALGAATKCIERLMATSKRYRTTIDLSAFTPTDDTEGPRTEVDVVRPPLREDIATALDQFVGDIMQTPPAFSAVKIQGRRSYKLARRGKPVAAPPRLVQVHQLRLLSYQWPMLDLEIDCGKGFYVRSLARGLGAALGTGGHCAKIQRTAVGPFTLEMARTLDAIPAVITAAALISIDRALEAVKNDQAD